MSAYRDGDTTVVLVPARLSKAEEAEWVATMLARLAAREARRRPSGDSALFDRARRLSAEWLDGRAQPKSVRWVSNQGSRWGSCTPVDGTIRLSDRMAGMPDWVVDYVLVHELAHLLVSDHSAAFWALVERFPRTERARGYLLGVVDGASPPSETEADPVGPHAEGLLPPLAAPEPVASPPLPAPRRRAAAAASAWAGQLELGW